ncbi:hypothetical protein LINPERPRIM_LOCUS21374 [Linum perenne]
MIVIRASLRHVAYERLPLEDQGSELQSGTTKEEEGLISYNGRSSVFQWASIFGGNSSK